MVLEMQSFDSGAEMLPEHHLGYIAAYMGGLCLIKLQQTVKHIFVFFYN